MALRALTIDLAANIANFTSDMDKAARIAQRDSERIKKQVEVAMKAIATSAIAAGAGLATLAKQTANTADNIQKMSQRLGVSTEFLSQMRHTTELTGVQFNSFTTALQRMTRRLSEVAVTGKGEAAPALEALGLSAKSLQDLAPEKQMLMIADAMKNVESQGERVRIAMKLFDTEGVALVQTLQNGSQAILDMNKEADAFGLTITQDAADGAALFNDELTRLQNQFKGITQQVALELLPEITSLITQFRQSDFVKNFSKNLTDLIRTTAQLADEFLYLAKTAAQLFVFSKVIGLVRGLSDVFAVAKNRMIEAGTAATTLGVAGRGVVGMLGGIPGVAAIAATAIYQLGSSVAATREEFDKLWQESEKRASDASRFGDEAQRAFAAGAVNIASGITGVDEAKDKLYEVERAIREVNRRISNTEQIFKSAGKELDAQARGEIEVAKQQLENLNKAAEILNSTINGVPPNAYGEMSQSVATWLIETERQVEALAKQNEEYGKSAIQLININAEKQLMLTTDQQQIDLINQVTAQLIAQTQQLEANKKAEEDKRKATEAANQSLNDAKSTLKSLRAEHRPIQTMFQDLAANLQAINNVQFNSDFSPEQFQEGMTLVEEQAEQIAKDIVDKVKGVYEEIPKLFGEAIEEAEDIQLDRIFENFAAGLNPAIGALQSFQSELAIIDEMMKKGEISKGKGAFYQTGLSAEFALNAMANMAQEGSDAQKKLQAAAAITNTILGIKAILTQGEGDPYTAWGRMAAMAAMVASMGVQVSGAFGGGSSGGYEQQQATQGTGTVLGDAEAKSESISNALDLIADTNEKIVGINSKMLRSLDNMTDAIAGTVTQIAKFGGIGELGTIASGSGDFITNFIDSFIFGKSKVTDRGIDVLSGSIAEAINGDIFQAYEIAKRKGLFGSSTRTNFADLDEGITNQIGLIFESMYDAVLYGAESLGVDLDAVQNALDTYQIEAQRISLMDLSPEEQQAELEAVFSSIFDGLVSVSIPFISQFQEAGEGLGETLARVSTTVLVFEEAIGSMGLDFIAKELDPELFAQAAVSIADFAGGMEAFVDGYTSYVNNFLSEQEQFDILSGRLSGVFADLGLTIPETRDGFKELIQGLDLTTEAGQEAFGTLIGLSSQMDGYYDSVEEAQAEGEARVQELASMIDGISDELENMDLSDFQLRLKEINRAFEEQTQTARELGASERELALIQAYATRQIEQALQALENDTSSAITNLYGSELDRINEQIALIESQEAGIQSVQQASDNLYESQLAAIQNITDFVDSLLLNEDLSPLNPQEQLTEAQRQFDALLSAAQGGDVDALNALPSIAQELLGFGRDVYASSDDYTALFESVTGSLSGLGVTASPSNNTGTGTIISQNAQLIELQKERNRLEAEFESHERLVAAQAIADNLGDIVTVTGESFTELADRLQLPITEFLSDLGINLEDVTSQTVNGLAMLSDDLNIGLGDLVDDLGLNLNDFADSLGFDLNALSTSLGVDLGSIDTELINSLDDLAQALGVDLTDLATALGGDLTEFSTALGIDLSQIDQGTAQALASVANALGVDLDTLSTALGIDLQGVANGVVGVEGSVDSLGNDVTGLENAIDNIGDISVDLDNSVDALNELAESIASGFYYLDNNVSSTNQSFNELGVGLVALSGTISNIREDMENGANDPLSLGKSVDVDKSSLNDEIAELRLEQQQAASDAQELRQMLVRNMEELNENIQTVMDIRGVA